MIAVTLLSVLLEDWNVTWLPLLASEVESHNARVPLKLPSDVVGVMPLDLPLNKAATCVAVAG